MPPPGTYVTIVSGMPRSGTSLMMRMLEAGGLPVVTDGRRLPDEHNPHGYFEDERVRSLGRDASWLHQARGHAVKIIYRLLPHLPRDLDCRILFMERDLDEVFDSQQDLLKSRREEAVAQDRTLIPAMRRELDAAKQWLAKQANVRYLMVPYAELVSQPETWAATVAQFLDGGIDAPAMAAAVDPALYRHRSA